MDELHPHLRALHDALRIEERAERDEHARLDALPLDEQLACGHAWPRLRLTEVEPAGRGVRAVGRAPRGVELHDGIQAGDGVWIEIGGRRKPGFVERVHRGAAELRVAADPPPEGAVAIVAARHDPSTFVRYRQALERAHEHRSPLQRVLLGERQPSAMGGIAELARAGGTPAPAEWPGLDEAQRRAAWHALRAPELAVVHGPPGTGKTRLLAKVLAALVAEGDRPWALADSNAAVDHLALAAAGEGLDVVRVGPVARIGEALEGLTLESRIRRSPLGPALHTLERDLARAWGTPDAWRLLRERDRLRADAKAHALSTAAVIATTFGTLARVAPELPPARTAVVDEATQATEPAAWVAVPFVERLVLVGDPYQLGPVSKVPGSPLERSLLERLVSAGVPLPMLAAQHRMATPLRELVRDVYGPGYVDASPSEAGEALFVDTAGAAEEVRDPVTLSMYSEVEVALVALAVRRLRAEGLDTGVIAPYAAQVARIRARVPDVEVATVNAFQGREKEAIVVSFVRSNDRGELGFVADPRRLTVSLTRAKRRLVLIGDATTLGRHPRFAALLAVLAERGTVRSVWEEPWVEALEN